MPQSHLPTLLPLPQKDTRLQNDIYQQYQETVANLALDAQ